MPLFESRGPWAPSPLLQSIQATYHKLRATMGGLALAFPLVLLIGGHLRGVALQGSMSAYYHTSMRDPFVGMLCTVGAALLLYKGFSSAEDWALNIGGALAIVVGLVPVSQGHDDHLTLHGAAAVLFFVALAYVAVFRSGDTLSLITNPTRVTYYRSIYRTLGAAMIVAPATAAFLVSVWQYDVTNKSVSFFVEFAGIYAFGLYWIVKSHEIRGTQRQRRARPDATAEPHLV